MAAKEKKQSLIGFIIFLILLLGWFTFSLVTSLKAYETKTWPTAEGTIVRSEIKILNSTKGTDKYKPLISYSFRVGDALYSSSRYRASLGYGTREWAEEVLAGYPVDKKVTVYYSPENPTSAVLVTGLSPRNTGMLLISGLLFVALLVLFSRQLKKVKAKT
ncbi:MAG: DUF3592 domain-containing protein [Bacteroidota bacterium]